MTREDFTDEDEIKLLNGELDKLYKRYNTKIYHKAFGNSPLTSQQNSNASWWLFYERKLKDLIKRRIANNENCKNR